MTISGDLQWLAAEADLAAPDVIAAANTGCTALRRAHHRLPAILDLPRHDRYCQPFDAFLRQGDSGAQQTTQTT